MERKIQWFMGFKLMDDSPERFPVQPEGDLPQDDDGQDVDIDVAEMQVEGQEIPVGQIAVRADPDDEIIVNGTKLKPTSRLAALRAGCAFYNLSSSGSKVKCFQRIAEHQKRLELEMVMAAAKDNQKELERGTSCPSNCRTAFRTGARENIDSHTFLMQIGAPAV